ncbi:MAG: GTP-binding protein [Cloacibacillus evryensis]
MTAAPIPILWILNAGAASRSAPPPALLEWRERKIYIIDTPGHSDFSSEVQRAVRAMDLAVIVVSAVEGVQSQTELIWHSIDKMGIPALFFINKTDRVGADAGSVTAEIGELTGTAPRPLELGDKEALAETLAEYDDEALEKFFEGGGEAFSCEELGVLLRDSFYSRKLVPVLSGAALKGEGVEPLLDLLAWLAKRPAPEGPPQESSLKWSIIPRWGGWLISASSRGR